MHEFAPAGLAGGSGSPTASRPAEAPIHGSPSTPQASLGLVCFDFQSIALNPPPNGFATVRTFQVSKKQKERAEGSGGIRNAPI